eukprot:TRINITY_DN1163_c0_g2_i2.p2 TRINITY_DN1163_c0_g2~~TRINITY_DN1163_c0_g2_i2.p2  ORF type:complete len:359 (-),score=128.59 TRINITY_DN1163_c0_g2_i2:35-1111(-)
MNHGGGGDGGGGGGDDDDDDGDDGYLPRQNLQVLQSFQGMCNLKQIKFPERIKIHFSADIAWGMVDEERGKVYLSKETPAVEWGAFLKGQNWATWYPTWREKENQKRMLFYQKKKFQNLHQDPTGGDGDGNGGGGDRSMEEIAKKEVKIASIFALNQFNVYIDERDEDEQLRIEKIYREFLDRVISKEKEITVQRKFNTKKYKKIDVAVADLEITQDEKGEIKKHFIHPDGILIVSMEVTPLELLEIISKQAAKVTEVMRENDKWDNVKRFLLVKLGLDEMGVGRAFAKTEDFRLKERVALEKIQRYADQIQKLGLRKLKLGISDRYGVGRDGTLWIPWNFQIDEFERMLLAAKNQSN